METARVSEALERLKGAFHEAPDARVSIAEASSWSGLDWARCRQLLEALEHVRFLRRGHDGLYERSMIADD